jgi:thiamine-phosphate pyrophosphorylase
VLRLVDANANRVLEGLRVCEEIVRFHASAPPAFRRLRALRHDIARAVRHLPVTPTDLVRARSSRRDVGRRAPSAPVSSLDRLFLVNVQRAKESLRVLEECSRLLAPRQAAAFQRLPASPAIWSRSRGPLSEAGPTSSSSVTKLEQRDN